MTANQLVELYILVCDAVRLAEQNERNGRPGNNHAYHKGRYDALKDVKAQIEDILKV